MLKKLAVSVVLSCLLTQPVMAAGGISATFDMINQYEAGDANTKSLIGLILFNVEMGIHAAQQDVRSTTICIPADVKFKDGQYMKMLRRLVSRKPQTENWHYSVALYRALLDEYPC